MSTVFVTGATGYMGSRLAPMLIARGHTVRALARAGSERRVPSGCEVVVGDALDAASFAASVGADTLVQLVGTPHPSPKKAAEFQRVDLGSMRASVAAARQSGVKHFVYVSVAQPAPVMRAYLDVRAEGERMLGELASERGVAVSVLRPWYVLGPGHRWPYLIAPMYWVLEAIPSTRDSARRLGLVTLRQMLGALAKAVDEPPAAGEVRVWDVPRIRAAGAAS